MLSLTEAIEMRNANPDLEHQLRAAKVVEWMLDNGEVNEEESEELYIRLIDEMYNSDEEYDSLALEIVREIREEKEEN
jgi:polyhydroxyalkanoate synthesis regulator phasin